MSHASAGLTVGALIARTCRIADRRTALVWEGRRIAYRDLLRRSNQVANLLIGAGLLPGDPVALVMGNSPEFITLYLGAVLAGWQALLTRTDGNHYHNDVISFP